MLELRRRVDSRRRAAPIIRDEQPLRPHVTDRYPATFRVARSQKPPSVHVAMMCREVGVPAPPGEGADCDMKSVDLAYDRLHNAETRGCAPEERKWYGQARVRNEPVAGRLRRPY